MVPLSRWRNVCLTVQNWEKSYNIFYNHVNVDWSDVFCQLVIKYRMDEREMMTVASVNVTGLLLVCLRVK